jgi:hypothetical protein
MLRAIVLLLLLAHPASAQVGLLGVPPAIGGASVVLGTGVNLTFSVLDVMNRKHPDRNLGYAEIASMGPGLVVDFIMMGWAWSFARETYQTNGNNGSPSTTGYGSRIEPVPFSMAMMATVDALWSIGLLAHGAWLIKNGRDLRVAPVASAGGGGLSLSGRF